MTDNNQIYVFRHSDPGRVKEVTIRRAYKLHPENITRLLENKDELCDLILDYYQLAVERDVLEKVWEDDGMSAGMNSSELYARYERPFTRAIDTAAKIGYLVMKAIAEQVEGDDDNRRV